MANTFYYAAPPAENKPLHLLLAGITDPEDTFLQTRGRTSPVYVFQYITGGTGRLREENLPETLCRKGDFLITHAWKAHSYFPDKKDPWSKCWINVTGLFPESLLRSYGLPEQCIFRNCTEAGELLRHTIPIIPKIPVGRVDTFMEDLLMRIVRLLQKHSVQFNSDCPAEKIRTFLLGHLMKIPPSMEDICSASALSPAQTIRVFKKQFGETPYSYLLNAKIRAAADVLIQTAAPIHKIAEEFGFSNEFYFSRVFRQRLGFPPGTFRNRNKND